MYFLLIWFKNIFIPYKITNGIGHKFKNLAALSQYKYVIRRNGVGNGRYMYPSDLYEHSNAKTHDRTSAAHPIALAHVQLPEHLRYYCIIFQHSLSYLLQNPMRIHHTTVVLNRASFARVLFNMLLFWQQFKNLKPLLQLTHEDFKTLCDQYFLDLHELFHTFHELSHTFQELSHSLHAHY